MAKYRLKYNQRYAVYKVFKGICQWCGEPVEYQNLHVDHVIPEDILKDPETLKKVLKSYGYDNSFDINDYENWIPAHPNCNQRKSTKAYEGLPIIKTILENCASNKSSAEKIEIKLNEAPKKSELLAAIEGALKSGIIDKKELNTLLLEEDVEDFNNQSEKEIDRLIKLGIIRLADRDRWKFVSKVSDDQIMVSDGVRGGIIPSSYPPHFSWLCPTCLSFGPWNGNRCESCGHFSTPD